MHLHKDWYLSRQPSRDTPTVLPSPSTPLTSKTLIPTPPLTHNTHRRKKKETYLQAFNTYRKGKKDIFPFLQHPQEATYVILYTLHFYTQHLQVNQLVLSCLQHQGENGGAWWWACRTPSLPSPPTPPPLLSLSGKVQQVLSRLFSSHFTSFGVSCLLVCPIMSLHSVIIFLFIIFPSLIAFCSLIHSPSFIVFSSLIVIIFFHSIAFYSFFFLLFLILLPHPLLPPSCIALIYLPHFIPLSPSPSSTSLTLPVTPSFITSLLYPSQ